MDEDNSDDDSEWFPFPYLSEKDSRRKCVGRSETEGGLGLEECYFCDAVADDMDGNLEHMSLEHGFFLPDLEYCTDLPGFLLYLGSLHPSPLQKKKQV